MKTLPTVILYRVCITVTAIMLLATPTTRAAKHSGNAPQWLTKGEAYLNSQRTNDTYYFKIIQNIGPELALLRQESTNALADYIGKRNKVQGLEKMEINHTQTQGETVSTRENYQMVFKNEFTSEAFYATLVDQYWEEVDDSDGHTYQYYALYAVSASGSTPPVLDRFEVSRSYGATPVFMSVIPGVGQLYKGNTVKGWCMLGGAVAGVGAIVFFENERASYATKIKEQPKHAQTYKTKADNNETARNVAIGVTGALVAWSIIDAAVAPGVTRIKISPNEQLRIQPAAFVTPQGTNFGATLCYTF